MVLVADRKQATRFRLDAQFLGRFPFRTQVEGFSGRDDAKYIAQWRKNVRRQEEVLARTRESSDPKGPEGPNEPKGSKGLTLAEGLSLGDRLSMGRALLRIE